MARGECEAERQLGNETAELIVKKEETPGTEIPREGAMSLPGGSGDVPEQRPVAQ